MTYLLTKIAGGALGGGIVQSVAGDPLRLNPGVKLNIRRQHGRSARTHTLTSPGHPPEGDPDQSDLRPIAGSRPV